MKHVFRTWFLGVTTVFALLTFVAATYAWFTSNRSVSTSTAIARTGDETLELQISDTGGNGFRSMETVPIQQVNSADAGRLMPVSTADLTSFVYAPSTANGNAVAFEPVSGENRIYHGRIYLRAVGEGWPAGSKMNLYLDQSNGVLGQNADGMLLNASRLGLRFDDDNRSTVILRLSEAANPSGQRAYNTVVNGQTLGDNQVLSWSNGSVQAVTDPSVSVSEFMVGFENNSIQLPSRTLLQMEFGRVYALDIYFYLEGCDPDCSDDVQLDAADIHLAFYGALSQEAGR